jgi:thiol-disulfide isomerase/thioredoxin
MKRILILIISLLAFGSGLLFLSGSLSKSEEDKSLSSLNEKNHLKEIQALLPYQLRDQSLEGKALVVNLWATWCGPCLEEIPELNQLVAGSNPSKIRFLAYSSEPESELAVLQANMPDFKFDYALVFEHLPLEDYLINLDQKAKGQSIPVHFLILPDGKLSKVLVGASPGNLSQISKFVKEHGGLSNQVKIEF